MAPALTSPAPGIVYTSENACGGAGFNSQQERRDGFATLVKDFSRTLGPSSGLTCADVDLEGLTRLAEEYVSEEREWGRYALGDYSRGYTRNLVDEGNGKSNLLVLVWTPGKRSPIHDHADAHCLMKILRGTLIEERFAHPENSLPPQLIKETLYTTNQVTYMSDDLGLHRIGNASDTEVAVSLHLYTPPNAAKEGCNIFDERTGRRSHVAQNNFYSVRGVLTK